MCSPPISCFSQVCLFTTLWTVAHQAPLSMGFSRQEYWSGLPCPSPGDLPHPGIKLPSLISHALAGRFFTTSDTCVCVWSLSHARLFATTWTAACQAPLSMRILQARILEWVGMSSSRGSSQPRDRSQVSCIAGGFFTI